MKIVFFDFVIHYGGGPQLAADTVVRLAAAPGVEIEVADAYGVCEPYLEKLRRAGVKVHVLLPEARDLWIGYHGNRWRRLVRLAGQVPAMWRLRRRLAEAVRRIGPEVIWSNSPKGSLVLGTIRALRGYPLVREYIGCRAAEAIPAWDRRLMRGRTAVVMAISSETARQLGRAGVPAGKIEIVFDTIDFAETLAKAAGPLEGPLPGMEKRPRLVTAGTLLGKKGQDTAIKALGLLKAAGLDPTLWLAGDVVGPDEGYCRRLERLVAEWNLRENVHFLGWRHDVPAIMAQADIVVHPSHEEGFGHVILEGMLLRRPVVATPVGGIQDSIRDGENGLLFSVGDAALLAAHIRRLHEAPEWAARLAEAGYRTVTERFAPERHTQRVLAALARAVTCGPARCSARSSDQ